LLALLIAVAVIGCKSAAITANGNKPASIPESYASVKDTGNIATTPWRKFFTDRNLIDLIDSALKNNQEFKITMQELDMAKNDIRVKKAALFPTVGIRAGSGVEKVGRYTSQGAGDASTEILPGKEMPDPLMDYSVAAYANWEIDIWKKLRSAKKAQITRYLSTVEGKNFMQTNLIAEVANSYYELLALNAQLEIVQQNIQLQQHALEIVKVEKQAARETELAVQKFEAEVRKSESMEFDIRQQIKETENKLSLLSGEYPKEIQRDKTEFLSLTPTMVNSGIPSQLLANRADIRQAELELTAAKLDVKIARAEFYPSLDISAAFGLQAFKPSYLVKFPESLLYSLVGDLTAPLINRAAIKAEFKNANARQLKALYDYDRSILNAYLEVSNQLSGEENLKQSYTLKSEQVEALNKAIDAANDLFKSARADYFEVLMTQRDALEAKLELIETKEKQLNTSVNIYRALGGGWK
jgi:NodT family efflux transporter outer membrane factor (OMF) lipoprotein